MKTRAVLLVSILVLCGCEREERAFRSEPAVTDELGRIRQSPAGYEAARPAIATQKGSRYEENAYHLSEGKRLFQWFNCNGCHANGGGGSGPALMDEYWKYGGTLEAIAATIRDGRPDGMPAFGSRIPPEQIWEIAAYVRSMARNVSSNAAPGRNDSMHPRPAENRTPAREAIPRTGGWPSRE